MILIWIQIMVPYPFIVLIEVVLEAENKLMVKVEAQHRSNFQLAFFVILPILVPIKYPICFHGFQLFSLPIKDCTSRHSIFLCIINLECSQVNLQRYEHYSQVAIQPSQ